MFGEFGHEATERVLYMLVETRDCALKLADRNLYLDMVEGTRDVNPLPSPRETQRSRTGHRASRQPLTRITPPPPKPVPKRQPARVARMLALANDLQDKLDRGEHKDQATLARELGFTPTKLTRLLDLALLAPDIQEEILFLEAVDGKEPVTERALRKVVRHMNWTDQRRTWRKLKA